MSYECTHLPEDAPEDQRVLIQINNRGLLQWVVGMRTKDSEGHWMWFIEAGNASCALDKRCPPVGWEYLPGDCGEGSREEFVQLKKLEQLLRKRIKLYKDSPPGGSRNWRANEDTYALLVGLLKEAGLE